MAYVAFTYPDKEEIGAGDYKAHMVVAGASGSGKSVLLKVLAENAAIEGLPVVVFDTHGDMAALAYQARHVLSREEIEVLHLFNERCEVRLFGITSGIRLRYHPLDLIEDITDRDSAEAVATALTDLLGMSKFNRNDAIGILSNSILNSISAGRVPSTSDTLEYAVKELYDGPKDQTTKRVTSEIVRKIAYKSNVWSSDGIPMNEKLWLPTDDGRTPISVIYLRDVSEETRQHVISLMSNRIISWMMKGYSNDGLVVVVDEASNYLRSHPYNPPAKRPISRLMKEGRKFNVGVIVSAQNPNELDSNAINQAGMWWVGKLNSEAARETAYSYFKSKPDFSDLEVGDFIFGNSSWQRQTHVRKSVHLDGKIAPYEITVDPVIGQKFRQEKTGLSESLKSAIFVYCKHCGSRVAYGMVCRKCKNTTNV